MGKSATSLFKRIALLLAEKSGDAYSMIVGSLLCQISFSLIRLSILCLRGSRRLFAPAVAADSAAIVVAETRVPH